MDIAAPVAWLESHLGVDVAVSVSGSSSGQGNSGAVLAGALSPGTHDWGTIDSRGGDLDGYDVGGNGGFFVLEGDFVEADVLGDTLILDLREVQIAVSVRPRAA